MVKKKNNRKKKTAMKREEVKQAVQQQQEGDFMYRFYNGLLPKQYYTQSPFESQMADRLKTYEDIMRKQEEKITEQNTENELIKERMKRTGIENANFQQAIMQEINRRSRPSITMEDVPRDNKLIKII